MKQLEQESIKAKALNHYKNLSEVFNRIQEDSKKQFNDYCEKIAFYSSAAISLSITFFGLFLSKKEIIDSAKNFCCLRIEMFQFFLEIPLYWFLYLGWALLLISLISGLYFKKINTLHLYFAAGLGWHESLLALNKANGQENDKEELSIVEERKTKEKSHLKLSNLTMKTAEISFVAGISLILLFVVFLANSLIQN